MKTVLVTGSNGLLGQKLTELYLGQANRVKLIASGTGPDRFPGKRNYIYQELDVTDRDQVMQVVTTLAPDCIIHTAAMTNVDQCETEKEKCRLLNVDAVQYLVEAANHTGAHLIHLSTDFIFDGENGPYREDDDPNPLSFYGHSKLDAETIVQKQAKSWAIVRTVLVYGIVSDMSRSNIVLWAKSALESGKTLKVVHDQFRTPTLAEDLAMGCKLVEEQEAQGIFNISGSDYMSVFELVERVAAFWKLPADHMERVSSSTLSQAAKRPPVTGFIIEKARTILGYTPHTFEQGLSLVDQQVRARGNQ